MVSDHAPLIALVNDKRFREPIQAWADKYEADVIWTLDLSGVVTYVAQLRPHAILVDVNHDSEWPQIVTALKTNAATRRYSILGFGIDLSPAQKHFAEAAGIDEVFDAQDSPRDKYLTTLETRLVIYARRGDAELQAELEAPCLEPLPTLVYQGIQQFNRGEYYPAHDALEEAWVAEERAVRNCYQGILQTGIAYHHIQKGNYWGAVKMFLRAFQWLAPLPEKCHGIHIAQLRKDAQYVFKTLLDLGKDHLSEFDQTLFTQIEIDTEFIPTTKEN